MIANYEKRNYKGKEKVWVGRYHNLNNMPHWHLECEIIQVESGQILVSHNNLNYTLEEGEAIFLGSGEVHYIKSESESIVSIVMFDPKWIRDITRQYDLCSAKLMHSYPIPNYVAQIKEELNSLPLFYEMKTREMIISLVLDIFRQEKIQPISEKKESSVITRYKELLDEVDERFAAITFSEAAQFMGLTEPYFSRFFRKISGMTFSQYLNLVRLEHAIELLNQRNGQSITEIAFACGFDTIRHFNRVFKETTGMSPKQMPDNYILNVLPIRKISDAFDPTLNTSELL